MLGKGLDAAIEVSFTSEAYTEMMKLAESLPEILNVSQIRIVKEEGENHATWKAVPATGTKCQRCWRYTEDVGLDQQHSQVCARCAEALTSIGYSSA